MKPTFNTDKYENWLVDNKIIEKSLENCVSYLNEYADESPTFFKKDLAIDTIAIANLDLKMYKVDLSFFNKELEIEPDKYTSVFIEIVHKGDIKAYYKCILDLSGDIFDDYLLPSDYF